MPPASGPSRPDRKHPKEIAMKPTIILMTLALLVAGAAHAADAPEKKSQQTRMAACSADAKQKELKGEARKQFMSECLSTKGAQTADKACAANAREKGLKGDARKKFVDDCMRGRTAGTVG